jgi:hypothetical protein
MIFLFSPSCEDEIKNAIGIVRQDSSKKKYVIYTKDPEQKQKWLSTLNQIANVFNDNNNNNKGMFFAAIFLQQ